MIVQRWKEYTTESAEKLANQRKIKLYPDRSTTSSSGTVWRHEAGGDHAGRSSRHVLDDARVQRPRRQLRPRQCRPARVPEGEMTTGVVAFLNEVVGEIERKAPGVLDGTAPLLSLPTFA